MPRTVALAEGYVSMIGYLYKGWDLEGVKLKDLKYTVTTHQAFPYTRNGKIVHLLRAKYSVVRQSRQRNRLAFVSDVHKLLILLKWRYDWHRQ